MTESLQELASRWVRLWATLIDALIVMACGFPVVWFSRIHQSGQITLLQRVVLFLFGIGVFLIINEHLLAKYGQTIGKRIVGIRIVSEVKPISLGRLFGLRYLPFSVIGLIPIVGQCLGVIDVFFIFRKDKRCIHDLIAGTKVVRWNKQQLEVEKKEVRGSLICRRSSRAKLLLRGLLVSMVCVCGIYIISCGKASFDGAKAMAETEALVKIGPREAGGGGARRASVLLESKLKALGLKTTIDTFSEDTPNGKMHFNNVLGRIPGKTNRLIVLASHFDTKSGISKDFQGANDSGSSSGVLLELARVLKKRGPHETEFLIAFFDGEECRKEYGPHDGLHGSRRLAQQIYEAGRAKLVEAVIVLDMIGDKNLNISIPRNSSRELVKELFFAAHELGVRPQFSIGPGSILDDHVPFLLAGMPVVDVIDFEYGSAPGLNDYWHTPNDTLDKLSVKSLQTVGDVVLKVVENLQ